MVKMIYRVETNYGSRYFNNGIQAYYYYEDMLASDSYVELWLIVKELKEDKSHYKVWQEVIAYRSCSTRYKKGVATWH